MSGCERPGTLAFAQDVAPDAQSGGGEEPRAFGAQLDAGEFALSFAELIAQSGLSLAGPDDALADERAYNIIGYSLEEEYADDFELHVFAPGGETESITLTMPLPALRSEDDVPNGDAAALLSVEEFNAARERERAAFMSCAEAALRAANKYKNSLSEADVLLVLSDTEKTVKRGSEQSEELSGALSRSFLLDVGYTPEIVFTIEFTL